MSPLILALTLAAAAPADVPPGWDMYPNVRYGYAVCYPPELKPGPEADNSDGRVFKGPHGSSVSAWGGYDALEHGLAGEMKMTVEDMTKDVAGLRGQVTYKVIRKDWFVVSGRNGAHLVYQRTWKVKDAFETLRFDYTQADQPLFDKLIPRMTACFHPGYSDN
jgi:hypothetical protein